MRNKVLLLFLLIATACIAADTVLVWPKTGDPILRFTVGKLRQVNSYSGQTDYVADALVSNLGSKPVPFASFYVYLLDKNHRRVGDGYIELSNVGPGQQVKVPLTAHGMGNVASIDIEAQHVGSDEPRKVAISVVSVPAGATLKVDGKEAGMAPTTLQLPPGKHELEFTREGYEPGNTPVEVSAGALPGSVNFELQPLTQDTVVLRNGTVLLGDVTSVTMTGVSVKTSGRLRNLSRNEVARLIFVERKAVKKTAKRK